MRVNTLRDLGAYIRERRRAKGLTIQQAASQVGVGRRLLLELERGRRHASVATVLQILQGLDLEMHVESRVD